MSTSRFLPLLSVGLICLSASATAAITTSGDFKDGSPTATLTITAPIVFQITANTSHFNFVLKNWVQVDSTPEMAGPYPGNLLFYQIDNGPTQTLPTVGLLDNFWTTYAELQPGDTYLPFDPAALLSGQTLTILPQSWNFIPGGGNFNTPPSSFEGDVLLVDAFTYAAVSNTVSAVGIPEPASALLGAMGVMALLRRRRA